MTLGLAVSPTFEPSVYQWAETESMARGFGSSFAIARQPSEYLLSSMAFMGEPCPTNMTGILSIILNSSFRRAKRAAKIQPSWELP